MKSFSLKFAHWALRFGLALGLAIGVAYVWAAPAQTVHPQPGGKAAVAQAQPPGQDTEKKHAQQERMKNCNAEARAKTLQGDERKTFMSQCLSNKPAEKAQKK